jgi:hypothetical protein
MCKRIAAQGPVFPENKFEEVSTFQCVLFGMVVAVAIVAILSVIALVAAALL